MPHSPAVSVVVPLFGDHAGRSLLPLTAHSWLAQSVACELVLAITGAPPDRLPESDRVRVVTAQDTTPGRLRNAAARVARAELLYLCDADVTPLDRDFLARLVELRRGSAAATVCQPWMYRLVEEHPPLDRVPLPPIDGGPEWCLATVADGRLRAAGGERLLLDGTDLMVVPEGADHRPGSLRWRPAFHWGGALVRRRDYARVGGYCETYDGWGCEDDDLLLKLGHIGMVVRAWRTDPAISCLHFEHPRPYDTPGFARNMALLRERKAAGADAMIRADMRDGSKRWAARPT
jgi:hypothetical protein